MIFFRLPLCFSSASLPSIACSSSESSSRLPLPSPAPYQGMSADTADHDDGCISVLTDRIPLRIGIGAQRHFVHFEFFIVENIVVEGSGVLRPSVLAALALRVEAPHRGIHGEAFCLQRILQRVDVGRVHTARAGAAVHEPGGVDAHQRDPGIRRKRKRLLSVQQKDRTARNDALNDFPAFLHLLRRCIIRGKVVLTGISDHLG